MTILHSHSDEQLLRLIKEDNELAFEELYSRYWKRMFAMAFLRLERRQIAEDVVQDVFTTLWQRREVLEIVSVEAWLATAVKYKVITLLNRQLAREIVTKEPPDNSYRDHLLDHRLLEQQLSKEVNKLPERCRLVFIYNHELGYSNREIAETLNISEKAVEKHITTARRKLHPLLRHLLHSLFSQIFFL